jgi:hypothetical protein
VVTFINLSWSEDCSLCLCQSSFITSDLVGPPHPSPMLALPLLGTGCLFFPPFWRNRPTLAPLPHADPISLRLKATAQLLIGHSGRHTNIQLVLALQQLMARTVISIAAVEEVQSIYSEGPLCSLIWHIAVFPWETALGTIVGIGVCILILT